LLRCYLDIQISRNLGGGVGDVKMVDISYVAPTVIRSVHITAQITSYQFSKE